MNKTLFWRAAVTVVVAAVFFIQEPAARAATPSIFHAPSGPESTGVLEYVVMELGVVSESVIAVVQHVDSAFVVVSTALSVYTADKSGRKAKKEGLPYGDGFIDGLIKSSLPGKLGAPTYIETNKAIYTGMRKLGDDPSLEGSWLAQQNQEFRKAHSSGVAH